MRIGYLAAGAVFGALWVSHSGDPLWETVLRLLVIMGVAMALSAGLRHWAAQRGRAVPGHSIGRFLIAKLGLLLLAVVAGLMLQPWVSAADLWIGVGMCALVAVAGPMLHPWLAESDSHTPAAV